MYTFWLKELYILYENINVTSFLIFISLMRGLKAQAMDPLNVPLHLLPYQMHLIHPQNPKLPPHLHLVQVKDLKEQLL